jgi:hypothetical protein
MAHSSITRTSIRLSRTKRWRKLPSAPAKARQHDHRVTNLTIRSCFEERNRDFRSSRSPGCHAYLGRRSALRGFKITSEYPSMYWANTRVVLAVRWHRARREPAINVRYRSDAAPENGFVVLAGFLSNSGFHGWDNTFKLRLCVICMPVASEDPRRRSRQLLVRRSDLKPPTFGLSVSKKVISTSCADGDELQGTAGTGSDWLILFSALIVW